MTMSWALLLISCTATAAVAFSLVRFGATAFKRAASAPARSTWVFDSAPAPSRRVPVPPAPVYREPAPEPTAHAPARSTSVFDSSPALSRRVPVPPAPVYREPAPEPTAPKPDDRLLELWAVQVEDGARKMTLATDGCRVTWNRRCKHGHPAWIVDRSYLTLDDA
jgi:hypothetical protein